MLISDIELPIPLICDKVFDLEKEFPGHTKYEVEIGTCSSLFLTKYANANPETFILGIEKKRGFFLRGNNNLVRFLKQKNVRVINFDAIAVLKEVIPFESLDAIHVYFPDPWPKKRHNERRIVNAENLRMFCNRLKPGGKLYFATDHADYAEYMAQEILGVKDIMRKLDYGRNDRKIMTKWEEKQIKNGFEINYFLLEKI